MKKIMFLISLILLVWGCMGAEKGGSSGSKSRTKSLVKFDKIRESQEITSTTLIAQEDTIPIGKSIQNNQKSSQFSITEQELIDTTPLRLVPWNIRNKIIPLKHRFGDYVLTRHLNGTYYLGNDSIIIRESYPNILLYLADDFGRLESKIEYYDTNQVLLNVVDLRKIPLPQKYISKSTFGLHGRGEFLSEVSPYVIPKNYKDIADSLLVDIEVSLRRASPYRVIDYSVMGLDKNQQTIGFENIVVVLDESGKEIFRESFGKTITGSFIDESSKFLCLDFSNTRYTDSKANVGALIIKELSTGKTLLNYKAKDGEYNGGLSFQEVKRDFLFFTFGPERGRRTEEIYAIRGLLDFKNRKFYKMTLTKTELERKKEENLFYFKEIDLKEWTLVQKF